MGKFLSSCLSLKYHTTRPSRVRNLCLKYTNSQSVKPYHHKIFFKYLISLTTYPVSGATLYLTVWILPSGSTTEYCPVTTPPSLVSCWLKSSPWSSVTAYPYLQHGREVMRLSGFQRLTCMDPGAQVLSVWQTVASLLV